MLYYHYISGPNDDSNPRVSTGWYLSKHNSLVDEREPEYCIVLLSADFTELALWLYDVMLKSLQKLLWSLKLHLQESLSTCNSKLPTCNLSQPYKTTSNSPFQKPPLHYSSTTTYLADPRSPLNNQIYIPSKNDSCPACLCFHEPPEALPSANFQVHVFFKLNATTRKTLLNRQRRVVVSSKRQKRERSRRSWNMLHQLKRVTKSGSTTKSLRNDQIERRT